MSIRTASSSALALLLAACAAPEDVWAPLRITTFPALAVALNRSAPGLPAREEFTVGPNGVPAVVETLRHFEDARRAPGVRCYEYRLAFVGDGDADARYGVGCAGRSNRWVTEAMARAGARPGTNTFRSIAAQAEARERSPR